MHFVIGRKFSPSTNTPPKLDHTILHVPSEQVLIFYFLFLNENFIFIKKIHLTLQMVSLGIINYNGIVHVWNAGY